MKTFNWKINAALFLGGQFLSLFGTLLVQYAITWHVTLKTGSGTMMTAFVAAGFLPMFFISPFAGVWADRFNRKYLINAADAVIAAATLIVALCFMAGYEKFWLLLLCVGIRSIGQGVQTPAVNAFIPMIVPREHYARVNGVNSTLQSFGNLLAPMLAGAIMSFMPITAVFFIDIITAVIGISIVFLFVRAAEQETDEKNKDAGYFRDILDGLLYIRDRGWLMGIMVVSFFFFLFVAPLAFLTNLKVVRDYGNEVWRLTVHEMTFSIGMTVGGAIMSVWGGFRNRSYSMGAGNVFVGIGAIGIGLVPGFSGYIVLMWFIGLMFPMFNVALMSLVQEKVDCAFMGRVFSVFGMLSSALVPVSMLIFGPLSDTVSLNALFALSGAVIIGLGLPFFVSKTMRDAGRKM
ncbi:MAG: MFS transporter [Synergistaceae bacterium]|jgi:DHA3 family macrolide efflux protein-like MFS transporter|nr:MFS transporter [Synergistaceae bacterium]